MQEWVSIYETNECDIRTPDIYRFMQVEELSTGPPGWGCHKNSLISYLLPWYSNSTSEFFYMRAVERILWVVSCPYPRLGEDKGEARDWDLHLLFGHWWAHCNKQIHKENRNSNTTTVVVVSCLIHIPESHLLVHK